MAIQLLAQVRKAQSKTAPLLALFSVAQIR